MVEFLELVFLEISVIVFVNIYVTYGMPLQKLEKNDESFVCADFASDCTVLPSSYCRHNRPDIWFYMLTQCTATCGYCGDNMSDRGAAGDRTHCRDVVKACVYITSVCESKDPQEHAIVHRACPATCNDCHPPYLRTGVGAASPIWNVPASIKTDINKIKDFRLLLERSIESPADDGNSSMVTSADNFTCSCLNEGVPYYQDDGKCLCNCTDEYYGDECDKMVSESSLGVIVTVYTKPAVHMDTFRSINSTVIDAVNSYCTQNPELCCTEPNTEVQGDKRFVAVPSIPMVSGFPWAQHWYEPDLRQDVEYLVVVERDPTSNMCLNSHVPQMVLLSVMQTMSFKDALDAKLADCCDGKVRRIRNATIGSNDDGIVTPAPHHPNPTLGDFNQPIVIVGIVILVAICTVLFGSVVALLHKDKVDVTNYKTILKDLNIEDDQYYKDDLQEGDEDEEGEDDVDADSIEEVKVELEEYSATGADASSQRRDSTQSSQRRDSTQSKQSRRASTDTSTARRGSTGRRDSKQQPHRGSIAQTHTPEELAANPSLYRESLIQDLRREIIIQNVRRQSIADTMIREGITKPLQDGGTEDAPRRASLDERRRSSVKRYSVVEPRRHSADDNPNTVINRSSILGVMLDEKKRSNVSVNDGAYYMEDPAINDPTQLRFSIDASPPQKRGSIDASPPQKRGSIDATQKRFSIVDSLATTRRLSIENSASSSSSPPRRVSIDAASYQELKRRMSETDPEEIRQVAARLQNAATENAAGTSPRRFSGASSNSERHGSIVEVDEEEEAREEGEEGASMSLQQPSVVVTDNVDADKDGGEEGGSSGGTGAGPLDLPPN